jgi:hypothetical protein
MALILVLLPLVRELSPRQAPGLRAAAPDCGHVLGAPPRCPQLGAL